MRAKHIFIISALILFLNGESEANSSTKELTEKEALALLSCEGQDYGSTENIEDFQTFAAIRRKKELTHTGIDILAAAYAGESELVRKILEQDEKYVLAQNAVGTTPLMAAAINGHADVVKLILEKIKIGDTIRLDVGDNKGNTALHYAIAGKHPDIVTLLRKHKANPNAYNDDEDFPVHDALTSKHLPTIDALLREEPETISVNTHVENCHGDSAVFTAGKTLDKEVITYFVPVWCKNGGLSGN